MPVKAKKPVAKSAKASTGTSQVPYEELNRLSAWLAKAPVNEVEVEIGNVRLRLSKTASAGSAAIAQSVSAVQGAPAKAEKPANTFNSPMVGTFYRAASPESAPFVKEGDNIQAGQTVCIIEAMKTMNQIAADRSGKVTKLLVQNAQPVEFGQPLFVIE